VIFSRYLMQSFFFLFTITLIFCTFLFLLFDFVDKSRHYFPTVTADATSIFWFYIYQIPYIILQSAPLAVLFSSSICLYNLSTSNEMTAMLSFGYSPRSLLRPLFVCGLILAIFLSFLSEFIIPKTSEEVQYIRKVNFEGKKNSYINKTNWSHNDSSFYSYAHYIPDTKKFLDLKIITLNKNFRLEKVEKIAKASYEENKNIWILQDIHTETFHHEEKEFYIEKKFSAKKQITLPISPDLLNIERRNLQELSLEELDGILERNKESGMDLLEIKIAWHTRLSELALCLVFIFGGFPLAFLRERRKESIFIFIKILGLGFAYWLLFSLFRAIILTGALPVFIGSWAPLGIISSCFFFQVQKTLKAHS
jgi:lipopolysaccharide export system permease protein